MASAQIMDSTLQPADGAPLPVTVQKRHINWALKAVLPIAAVLLNGLLLFMLVSSSLAPGPRNDVIAVAAAGAIVICVAVLMVLAVMVRRPMSELQEKFARVQMGDLDAAVSFADRNDEIGDLGRDFNDMVAQLKASREEIHRLHQTQMSRAEHFATLGELAAGLAHEIRNPLAGIAGVLDIASRDLPNTSPARNVMEDAKQEAAQINRILTELLDTARPKPPQFRVTDIVGTVEHAVLFARQQAVTKRINIEFAVNDALPLVEHDPGQVNQVMLNLLLNAIQSMDKPGIIRVNLGRLDDDTVAVMVADQGKGIAPEHLPNIFRPFFTTKGHGTGLGLSLARRIVEAHGGNIEVESTLGQGTRFIVELPVRRVQEQAS
ncbi:MAG TPA: ATP-binding protein [Candidatus Angelobacter sp.]|jgi:signal transduction histidine kinase|nr:ATP-binding protein [Candidatus Angelobacter sp.]